MTDRDELPTTPGATRRTLLLGAGAAGAVGVLAACGGTTPQTTPPGNETVHYPGALPPAGATEPPAGATNPPAGATNPPAGATNPPAGATKPPPADGGGGIKVADIPVGGGKIYADQRIVVTQPTAGTFKAFDSACTHLGCAVTGVNAGKIRCGCHGSEYRVADGSVSRGPATQALAAKTVTVSGTSLTVS